MKEISFDMRISMDGFKELRILNGKQNFKKENNKKNKLE